MTTVTTQNPVRTDLASTQAGSADRTSSPSRLWAVAGIGAALAGAGTIVTSSAVNVVYRDDCARVDVIYRREDTVIGRLGPSSTVSVRLTLATLGGPLYGR